MTNCTVTSWTCCNRCWHCKWEEINMATVRAINSTIPSGCIVLDMRLDMIAGLVDRVYLWLLNPREDEWWPWNFLDPYPTHGDWGWATCNTPLMSRLCNGLRIAVHLTFHHWNFHIQAFCTSLAAFNITVFSWIKAYSYFFLDQSNGYMVISLMLKFNLIFVHAQKTFYPHTEYR